jgi:hypothetical protein
LLPAMLPEFFVESKHRHFPGRKRAMVSRETAENQEQDKIEQKLQAAIRTQTYHVVIADMVLEHQYVCSVTLVSLQSCT